MFEIKLYFKYKISLLLVVWPLTFAYCFAYNELHFIYVLF